MRAPRSINSVSASRSWPSRRSPKLTNVAHTVGDHASILAFIEERFLNDQASADAGRLHLTPCDQYASSLEDLFDFDNARRSTPVIEAHLPVIDCTPAGF